MYDIYYYIKTRIKIKLIGSYNQLGNYENIDNPTHIIALLNNRGEHLEKLTPFPHLRILR